MQCRSQTLEGHRCSRDTISHSSYCWQHQSHSSIQHYGSGLFTKKKTLQELLVEKEKVDQELRKFYKHQSFDVCTPPSRFMKGCPNAIYWQIGKSAHCKLGFYPSGTQGPGNYYTDAEIIRKKRPLAKNIAHLDSHAVVDVNLYAKNRVSKRFYFFRTEKKDCNAFKKVSQSKWESRFKKLKKDQAKILEKIQQLNSTNNTSH